MVRLRRTLACIGLMLLASLHAAPAKVLASAPQNWLRPAGPVAEMQLSLYLLTMWLSIGVCVIVIVGIVYVVTRFKDGTATIRPDGTTVAPTGPDETPTETLPRQIEGDNRLEALWTIIPFILLVMIAIPTVRLNFALAADPEGEPVNIFVTGHQWWWEFEYTDYGIVTGNEIRIPVGRPINMEMVSNDVIHKFWVPKLAGKLDVLPTRQDADGNWAQTNKMWIQADEPGVYWGQCAEMCGVQHANMRMRVVALPEDEFHQWVENFGSGPVIEADADVAAIENGQLLFTQWCGACHTVAGTPAAGKVGPNLTDIGGRLTVAAGIMDNNRDNLKRWISDPQGIKPGSGMPLLPLSDEQFDDIVEFLLTLK